MPQRLWRQSAARAVVDCQYETNSDDFRQQFEQYGEVKEWFDAIPRRGMVFVTFVSAIAALTIVPPIEADPSLTFVLPRLRDRE